MLVVRPLFYFLPCQVQEWRGDSRRELLAPNITRLLTTAEGDKHRTQRDTCGMCA